MNRTDLDMSELSKFLKKELDASSYRELAHKTNVSRGALENIINGTNTKLPELETLEKIATAYSLTLWQVIERAGVDLGLPKSVDETVSRLTDLARRIPEIEPIVVYLLKLYPEDLRGVVAYLEALDRQRNRDWGWAEQ